METQDHRTFEKNFHLLKWYFSLSLNSPFNEHFFHFPLHSLQAVVAPCFSLLDIKLVRLFQISV